MPERHDIFPNRSKGSYSDPTRHGYPDPYSPAPKRRKCWKCGGKGYAMSSYPARPIPCRACEGTGYQSAVSDRD